MLGLLYRGGEPHDLGATARQWHDLAAMTARVPDGARATGHGGVGYLLDAVTQGKSMGLRGRPAGSAARTGYRLEFSRSPGPG